jgi:uroporphyrin-III C-methyltransferase
MAPPEARRIYAGKAPGRVGPLTQDEINALLCSEAQAGRVVVRLKGGDPFVFGRGGEEMLAAAAAGVPVSVIPGVTAAIAVPAAAGIPVTHRGVSSMFTVLTGQQGPTATAPIDWEALVRLGGTLVLLMGVETLPNIVGELLAAGMNPELPAAVIEQGTLPEQRSVTGPVRDIVDLVSRCGITSPATTVLGDVAGLAV